MIAGAVPKYATWETWDYVGPAQAEDGTCERCGCCDTHYDTLEDGYMCNGFCDRNALHPPDDGPAHTPEQRRVSLLTTMRRKQR